MDSSVAQKNRVRDHKKAQVMQKLTGFELLGEIITWNAKADASHTHKSVVQALKDSDLDETVARELLPRFAFSRACKKLAEERIVNVLNEDSDTMTFQFNRKELRGETWDFPLETKLQLNKTTGKITCQLPQLEGAAQKELDRCMEARTTADITKIVQTLFDRKADLFPIRDQGGAYFVPKEHSDFVSKIEHFLHRLNGSILRFPVPAGTDSGNKAVQLSVGEALAKLIQEHDDEVKSFTINTRADTIEHRAEKIKATRVRIEAYANYLGDKQAELLAAVDSAKKELADKIASLTATRASAPPDSQAAGNRLSLFGHSVTAVIRWMGKAGWGFDKAKAAIAAQSISIADATIRAQLLAGKKGERGDPAALGEAEIKQLSGV